jgi:hypothetical protein
VGAVLVFIAMGAAACNGAQSAPTATGAPTAIAPTPPASVPVASATPIVTPSTPASSAPSPGTGGVIVDLSLLEHLPGTVDGLPVEPDAATSTSIAGSPGLAADASAIAIGRVVAPGSDDLAIASIVRLRSGPFDDAAFATWRATYDQAACEPAGGVAATSERQVGGRQVFVAACNGGAQTFHVALGDDFIVSITAIGERHLGDLLVAGLRE